MIEGSLFEISGAYIAYQSEYGVTEAPWTLVVAVDSDEVNALLRNAYGGDLRAFPVVDSTSEQGWDQLVELKKQVGYKLNDDGEFEVDNDRYENESSMGCP